MRRKPGRKRSSIQEEVLLGEIGCWTCGHIFVPPPADPAQSHIIRNFQEIECPGCHEIDQYRHHHCHPADPHA